MSLILEDNTYLATMKLFSAAMKLLKPLTEFFFNHRPGSRFILQALFKRDLRERENSNGS